LNNGKGIYVAKELVLGKLEEQNQVLSKYVLERDDNTIQETVKNLEEEDRVKLRTRLMSIEGHFSDRYSSQIFGLIPESLRPKCRKTFKAYDGVNNIFNLAYEMLSWKAHHALIKAKLEPYLGFMHSLTEGKPSLICDFQELYRYLIDDFVIQYCRRLNKQDFTVKSEDFSTKRKGKREYLNDSEAQHFVKALNQYFQNKVKVPRVRMDEQQETETLISEEALLLAGFIRNEAIDWRPRIIRMG
jgi:CRISPR-associated protein Cas1